MMQGIGQKVVEWAVVAALVGVIGYLIGNSDAMEMKSRIDALERQLNGLEMRVEKNGSQLEERSIFMTCAVRNIDRLNDKMGLQSTCPLDVAK